MEMVRDLGVHEKIYILAGITPSSPSAWPAICRIPCRAWTCPKSMIERLKGVPKEKVAEEGIKIAVETIERVRQIKGVAGVHIMAIEWEEKVPEIVEGAKLLPRP